VYPKYQPTFTALEDDWKQTKTLGLLEITQTGSIPFVLAKKKTSAHPKKERKTTSCI